MKKMLKRILSPRHRLSRKLRIFCFDAKNMVLYGRSAPRKFMLMYVRTGEIPQSAARRESFPVNPKRTAEVVLPGNWDLMPAERGWGESMSPILQGLRTRIMEGVAWSHTGLVDRMEKLIEENASAIDGCRDREDVLRRYHKLDEVISFASKTRTLRSQSSVSKTFRELGGIDVAIGRNGDVLRVGGGNHRLAIAILLELPVIPVCVNAVHPFALKSRKWSGVLKRSKRLAELCGKNKTGRVDEEL